jgi:hypothetical protein
MTDKDRDRGSQGKREVRQVARDDSKLDLNAQGRQGSGSTDRDQASNVGSGFNEEAPMKGEPRGQDGRPPR